MFNRRRWLVAMISSIIMNAFLIVADAATSSQSGEESPFQHVIRVLGMPGGAITEMLMGNRHPDSAVIMVLLLCSFGTYVLIFWLLLTAYSMTRRT